MSINDENRNMCVLETNEINLVRLDYVDTTIEPENVEQNANSDLEQMPLINLADSIILKNETISVVEVKNKHKNNKVELSDYITNDTIIPDLELSIFEKDDISSAKPAQTIKHLIDTPIYKLPHMDDLLPIKMHLEKPKSAMTVEVIVDNDLSNQYVLLKNSNVPETLDNVDNLVKDINARIETYDHIRKSSDLSEDGAMLDALILGSVGEDRLFVSSEVEDIAVENTLAYSLLCESNVNNITHINRDYFENDKQANINMADDRIVKYNDVDVDYSLLKNSKNTDSYFRYVNKIAITIARLALGLTISKASLT